MLHLVTPQIALFGDPDTLKPRAPPPPGFGPVQKAPWALGPLKLDMRTGYGTTAETGFKVLKESDKKIGL